MKNNKGLKILGIAATLVGMVASLVSSHVADKKLDATVEKKVAEALAKTVEAE